MKDFNFIINGGTGELTFYWPVRYRGIVKAVKAVFQKTVAIGDTIDIQRGSTSVNLLTTTVVTAGVTKDGTPDSTNNDLIFDPDSDTAANRVLKIVISALETASTLIGITIQYDDSAAVTQDASES